MAGTSPRRSSRARTVGTEKPPQSQSQSQHSSNSSTTSSRAERQTRSFKAGSPQKSTPSASLSSEPPDDLIAGTDDLFSRRRRTRAQDDERDRLQLKVETVEMATGIDEIQEDDEAVRCICGFDEYPGPPPLDGDKKPGTKDSIDAEPLMSAEITDDLAGFFVQCDICKVWQHGACVGIMTEESSPDEYFCEECRKDLHKIYTASNGQRYSHYLPLMRHSRTTSRANSLSQDGPRSPKGKETRSGRQSSLTQASKRRSTMNSRDAAYDEEEQLRRAIEASKEDAIPEQPEANTRQAKRGRSDSEENPDSAKRQRTSSRSASPIDEKVITASRGDDSDDGSNARNGAKKPRSSTAARTQKERERAEKEERERLRAEAANKRKGRAERRRGDGDTPASTILVKGSEAYLDTDSDPSEELPLAARAPANRTTTVTAAEIITTTMTTTTTVAVEEPAQPAEAPPSSQPTPDTPPANSAPQASSRSKRSHQKKGKGRNQYTKDRDLHDEPSPARSQSRDVHGHDSGTPAHHKTNDHSKSHSRSKGGFNSKVSMTELKRRATMMFDFISKTQLELAGDTTPPDQEGQSNSASGSVPQIKVNGASSDKSIEDSGPAEPNVITNQVNAPKEFRDLNCVEMMDILTRDLVKWQKEFAT